MEHRDQRLRAEAVELLTLARGWPCGYPRPMLSEDSCATFWFRCSCSWQHPPAPKTSPPCSNTHLEQIEKPSRQTIAPVIDTLSAIGPQAGPILEAWTDQRLGLAGNHFVILRGDSATDAVTGAVLPGEVRVLKPHAGVRGQIGAALVQFQLTDPDPARRAAALDAIAREPGATHLASLRSAPQDPSPTLAARKARLERLLTIRFEPDPQARIAAIKSFSGDTGADLQAVLNPLLATARVATPQFPEDANIAAELIPGDEIGDAEAYQLLVDAGFAPPRRERLWLLAYRLVP